MNVSPVASISHAHLSADIFVFRRQLLFCHVKVFLENLLNFLEPAFDITVKLSYFRTVARWQGDAEYYVRMFGSSILLLISF